MHSSKRMACCIIVTGLILVIGMTGMVYAKINLDNKEDAEEKKIVFIKDATSSTALVSSGQDSTTPVSSSDMGVDALTEENEDRNRYYVAGIDDAAAFEKVFAEVQQLVKQGDAEKVAEYVSFPVQAYVNGVRITIHSEEEFIHNYDQIMNPTVQKALLEQKVEETFVNYKGVMVGHGELWFTPLQGTKHIYCIYGINNQPQE